MGLLGYDDLILLVHEFGPIVDWVLKPVKIYKKNKKKYIKKKKGHDSLTIYNFSIFFLINLSFETQIIGPTLFGECNQE